MASFFNSFESFADRGYFYMGPYLLTHNTYCRFRWACPVFLYGVLWVGWVGGSSLVDVAWRALIAKPMREYFTVFASPFSVSHLFQMSVYCAVKICL